MLNNYYLVKIKGKDVKRFLKYLYRSNIGFINIAISNNELICKIDSINYKKLLDIKTSYEIEVIKLYGFNYLKKLIKNNMIFIIFFIFGIIYLFILSKMIFKINIIHDDKEIVNIIENELNKYNIKEYSFSKSYNYIQKVKENIINNNKDVIEWIEIEKVGGVYNIKVDKRIKNEEIKKNGLRHLVAKKSGIIKKIEAKDGEIIKKVNDYVNAGDIIISGEIHKGEDIKNNLSVNGKVYAEVWYKVRVSMPLYYYEEKKTGNSIKTLKIKYLDKEYNIFNKNYKYKKSNNIRIFNDFYNMISINYSKDEEIEVLDLVNSIEKENYAVILARDKIINQLDSNEYIISQKKLKTTINNSTINVEVFFKVYEDISSYRYYNLN